MGINHDIMQCWLRDEENLKKINFPDEPITQLKGYSATNWLKENHPEWNTLQEYEEWYSELTTKDIIDFPEELVFPVSEEDIIKKYNVNMDMPNGQIELKKKMENEKKSLNKKRQKFLDNHTGYNLKRLSGIMTWSTHIPTPMKEKWDIRLEHILTNHKAVKGSVDVYVEKTEVKKGHIIFKKDLKPINSLEELIQNKNCRYEDLWEMSKTVEDGEVYTQTYIIEIKPTIQDCGGVIRQLKIYGENCPRKCVLCVFTTDTRFNKEFENEGIMVIETTVDEMREYGKQRNMEWED